MQGEKAFGNNVICPALLPCLEIIQKKKKGKLKNQKRRKGSKSEAKAMDVIAVASITPHQAVCHNSVQQTLHMCLLASMPNTFLCSGSQKALCLPKERKDREIKTTTHGISAECSCVIIFCRFPV